MSLGQGHARAALARKHPKDYRKIYLEVKESILKDGFPTQNTRLHSAVQSRTFTRLTKLHHADYQELLSYYKKLLIPAK